LSFAQRRVKRCANRFWVVYAEVKAGQRAGAKHHLISYGLPPYGAGAIYTHVVAVRFSFGNGRINLPAKSLEHMRAARPPIVITVGTGDEAAVGGVIGSLGSDRAIATGVKPMGRDASCKTRLAILFTPAK
jgi:hypothetical protein